jgi:hypothetical protein
VQLPLFFTHKWLLNPFSYSGKGWLSATNYSAGGALRALAWWVGLCALKLLSGITRDIGALRKLCTAFTSFLVRRRSLAS